MPADARDFALHAIEALAAADDLAEHERTPEFALVRALAIEAYYSDFVAPGSDGPGAWADIDTVTVRSYDLVVDSIGGRYTESGASFTRCQFSLPYLVAVALADGRLGIPQLTSARRADPLVHALAGRVRVTEDPALTAQYPERFPYEVEVMVRGSALVPTGPATRVAASARYWYTSLVSLTVR